MRKHIKNILEFISGLLLGLIVVGVIVALAYQFLHPEMTATQLFIKEWPLWVSAGMYVLVVEVIKKINNGKTS